LTTRLNILNKKATKEIYALLKKQWDFDSELDFAFLQDTKNRIYIANKDFAELDLEKLRLHSVGLYFGIITNNELRLSIEGSEIIGKKAKKNITELDDQQAKAWLRGEDIEIKTKSEGFVIIKNKNDFLGTGKAKENKILNYIPKERRVRVNN